jgi:hypothetical protein
VFPTFFGKEMDDDDGDFSVFLFETVELKELSHVRGGCKLDIFIEKAVQNS